MVDDNDQAMARLGIDFDTFLASFYFCDHEERVPGRATGMDTYGNIFGDCFRDCNLRYVRSI